MSPRFYLRAAVGAVAALLLLTGCSSGSSGSAPAKVALRLGFLTRITHASALVGVGSGIFAKDLGPGVALTATPFGRGTDEATALLAGQIDAAYVGPDPAFNAWQKSHGTAIRIVSGSAAAGTSLVVRNGITSADQLRGQAVADPALGGNQDVGVRYWLQQQGLHTDPNGGGDVFVKPTKPESAIVPEFVSGQIAGAMESAPYDVQLLAHGGTRLWSDPGTITVLVVRQAFLREHPDLVAKLLRGQVEANDYLHADPAGAAKAANAELARTLGSGLSDGVLTASFAETVFTDDPGAASLAAEVRRAAAVGLLDPVDLTGIYDLDPLNEQLRAAGEPQVHS